MRGRERLEALAQGYVARGELAGVAALVWRDGEGAGVVTEGWADIAGRRPLARDTIFRIASMTKPIVSVAALMLLEDGRLTLNDPLTRWLPEAAGLRVLRAPDAALDDVVAPVRPPSLHDLVTHRAGFAGSLAVGPTPPVVRAMAEATGPMPASPHAPDAFAARVCAVPLIVQPGTCWHYGVSTDLLGVVVARAAGTDLATFLAERLFAPLGMADTGFFVPPDRIDRLATLYAQAPDGALAVHDDPSTGHWSRAPVFPAGGGGLVSTLDDYLAFARMLLAGGVHDGARLLSRASVAMMTAPHLAAEQIRPLWPALDILRGRNFGLGVSIGGGNGPELGYPGKYGWPGAFGSDWFTDPAEGLIGIVMSQLWFGGGNIRPAFANAVYRGLDDRG